MYTPFVRGKQFELLGLREITGSILHPNKEKVSPIIEPVKLSSTLSKTLKEFEKFDINFTLIINPTEGDLKGIGNVNLILETINNIIPSYNNYQLGIINTAGIDHHKVIDYISKNSLTHIPITFVHNLLDNSIVQNLELYPNTIKYNIINQEYVSSRFKNNFDENTRILFGDHFQAQDTNREYLHVEESDFSDDYKFFKEEGYIGFGDFGTVGSSYSDKGFLPYAVAIHLSYFNKDVKLIKVRHFTSDSNDDQYDTPNKFNEAINKLAPWIEANIDQQDYTKGIEQFLDLFHRDIAPHYPGLGTLKKISLINHIELIIKLI